MPVKYFSIEGFATFLRHAGATTLPDQAPDVSRGEVLLCLHHRIGNCGNFDSLLSDLEAQHSPLAFDLPGHDRSGGLDGLGSIDAMATFTEALLSKLGLRPTVVLGHDMGAAVALQLAINAPQRVRALVLCGGAPRFEIDDSSLEKALLVSQGKARRDFDMTQFSPNATPDVLRAGFMDTVKTDPRVVYSNLVACQGWVGEAQLADLDVPALVCIGADETPARAAAGHALAAALPHAEIAGIPDSGHMIPMEQPQALADAIRNFLKGLT